MHTATDETRFWTQERNLSLNKAERRRETVIYLLGRVGREPLPAEVWAFLAENCPLWWSKISTDLN